MNGISILKIARSAGIIAFAAASGAAAEWVDVDGEGLEQALVEQAYVWDNAAFSLDSKGYPHFAYDVPPGYELGTSVHYLYYDGNSWVSDGFGGISGNLTSEAWNPALIIDSKDRAHVLFVCGPSASDGIYTWAYVWSKGGEWVDADGEGLESAISFVSSHPYHPPLFALDSSDRPHVIVHDTNNAGETILSYQYFDGVSWKPLEGMEKDICFNLRIFGIGFALDTKDRPHIVFHADHPPVLGESVYHLYYEDGAWRTLEGGILEEGEAVPPVLEDIDVTGYGGLDFALDSLDRPHIIFDPDESQAYYYFWNGAEWVDSSGKSAENPAYTAIPVGDYSLDIRCDSQNRPHIASATFFSPSYDRVVYIFFDGSSWVNAEGEPLGDALNCYVPPWNYNDFIGEVRLDLDQDDVPHLAWNTSGGELYYVRHCPSDPPEITLQTDKKVCWTNTPVTLELTASSESGIDSVSLNWTGPENNSITYSNLDCPESFVEKETLFLTQPGFYTFTAAASSCACGAGKDESKPVGITVVEGDPDGYESPEPVVKVWVGKNDYVIGQPVHFTISATAPLGIDKLKWELAGSGGGMKIISVPPGFKHRKVSFEEKIYKPGIYSIKAIVWSNANGIPLKAEAESNEFGVTISKAAAWIEVSAEKVWAGSKVTVSAGGCCAGGMEKFTLTCKQIKGDPLVEKSFGDSGQKICSESVEVELPDAGSYVFTAKVEGVNGAEDTAPAWVSAYAKTKSSCGAYDIFYRKPGDRERFRALINEKNHYEEKFKFLLPQQENGDVRRRGDR